MKHGLTVLFGAAMIALLLGASPSADTTPTLPSIDWSDQTDWQAMEMKKILKKCKVCHGKDLAGKQKKKKKTPGIAGHSKKDILKSLTTKIPKPMRAIAKALTDEEKAAVSDLISKMPKPAEKPAAP